MSEKRTMTSWPTLGETAETCPRCDKPLTGAMITSCWSPTRFTVACKCSPTKWIEMEIVSANIAYRTEGGDAL